MPMTSPDSIQECVTLCWECRNECQKTLYRHWLDQGEKLGARDHVRIMSDCIEICQTAADFMTRESPLHTFVCESCAAVCEACAESCAHIGGEEMERCAEACQRCAASCRQMGGYSGEESQRAIGT